MDFILAGAHYAHQGLHDVSLWSLNRPIKRRTHKQNLSVIIFSQKYKILSSRETL